MLVFGDLLSDSPTGQLWSITSISTRLSYLHISKQLGDLIFSSIFNRLIVSDCCCRDSVDHVLHRRTLENFYSGWFGTNCTTAFDARKRVQVRNTLQASWLRHVVTRPSWKASLNETSINRTKIGDRWSPCHIAVELRILRRPKRGRPLEATLLSRNPTIPFDQKPAAPCRCKSDEDVDLRLRRGCIDKVANAWLSPERIQCRDKDGWWVTLSIYSILSGISLKRNSSLKNSKNSIDPGEIGSTFWNIYFPVVASHTSYPLSTSLKG